MEDAITIVILLVFLGPWPLVALAAGLRLGRQSSQPLAGLEALVRVLAAIVVAFVLIVVAIFAAFVWANVASDKAVLVVVAHAIALLPASWVTRIWLTLPFQAWRQTAGRILSIIWLAFWIPVMAFFIFALVYDSL